jgi:hypothetical protein
MAFALRRKGAMMLFYVLGAVLVVLKAIGISTLSWGWTLLPFFVPLIAFLVALLFTGGALGAMVLGGRRRTERILQRRYGR